MKSSPVRLIIGTAVYVAASPKARARVGDLVGQARQQMDRSAVEGLSRRARASRRTCYTPDGDVESEDRAGTWADDGGVVASPPGGTTSA